MNSIKENMDDPFPKDKDGNRLYSDVHYIETYHVNNYLIISL